MVSALTSGNSNATHQQGQGSDLLHPLFLVLAEAALTARGVDSAAPAKMAAAIDFITPIFESQNLVTRNRDLVDAAVRYAEHTGAFEDFRERVERARRGEAIDAFDLFVDASMAAVLFGVVAGHVLTRMMVSPSGR